MSQAPAESTRDRKDLKNQALLERIAQVTAQYEDQLAELRVEYTLLSEENESLKNAKKEDEDSPE